MEKDLPIKNGIVIPGHELEITTSRSGGPGGQHVNKTQSRVTIRWNARTTHALSDMQKERVLQKLQTRLTSAGDLLMHDNTSRSQQQNKDLALFRLSHEIRKALHVPKKRIKSRTPKAAHEKRLRTKSYRSTIKKMRRISFPD